MNILSYNDLVSFILIFLVIILIPFQVYGFSEQEKKETYEIAENYFLQKNYHQALMLYDDILNDDPQYANALGGKAAVFHRQGNYTLALEYYDRAISINSTNPYFLSDKGNLLLAMGDDKGAEINLRQSLKLIPDFVDALNGLANVYSHRQDYDNALLFSSSILVIQPDNQEALIGIGNAFHGKKEYGKAIEQYNKVLNLNSLNVNALIGKGNAYVDLKEFHKAIDLYDQALNIEPNNVNALHGSSVTYLKIGEYEKSVELDRQLDSVNSNTSDVSNHKIPLWVKNVFGWYSDNKISEDEVINVIKFLIENKILILKLN